MREPHRGHMRLLRRRPSSCWPALLVACAVLFSCSTVQAAPGLFVGVTDDTLKATPAETSAVARDLGLRAFSLSLRWTAGETALSASAAGALGTAVRAVGGARPVVYVFGDVAPASPEWREDYCSYARDLLVRFPQVNDVVIWNEPNLIYFWSPQFEPNGASLAPAQYEALLERCYDVLHGVRPGVNVVAPASSPWGNDDPFAQSNASHSPTSFILQLGRAYRASGRARPIFDTLGHHPHPVSSNERPWLAHPSERFISFGDLDRLVGAVTEAFTGTAQPTPGRGLPIWYLETGYQTVPDAAKQGLYSGVENWPGTLPDDAGGEPAQPPPAADSAAPDQSTQLVDSLRLAYCQPYVQAVFNFQLRDEPELGGWQSGVLWADGTRKDSYDAFRRVVAEVNNRAVDCSRLKGGVWAPDGASQAAGAAAATPKSGAAKATGRGRQSVDRRRATRLAWAARPAPFGYARVSARLMAGPKPLAGRQVTFGFGGMLLLTSTGKTGLARVPLAHPLPPGAHLVTVSFRGSRTLAPSGLKVLVQVKNSRATITTAAGGRELAGSRGGFRVSSNGRSVAGSIRIRAGTRVVHARRLNALGVSADGRSSWFAGRSRSGMRLVGRVGLAGRKGGDTLRLWVGGKALPLVRGLDVRILRARR